jgi:hypothetical protein
MMIRQFSKFVAAGAVASALLVPATASAAITQQARVSLTALGGTLKPKGRTYIKVDAYLSTRDAASTRNQMEANPVGVISINFPPATVLNAKATPGCHMNQYSAVSALRAACAKSQIGSGWALVNTAANSPFPREQLADLPGALNSPPPCGAGNLTQYMDTYSNGVLPCVPIGHLWNRVRAYQGAIIAGKYTPNAVIFANDNAVSGIAFAGTVKGNVLSVKLPALNGTGSGAGELPFGWVLSDFRLLITKTNYMKAPSCPASTHKWTVKTNVGFSKFKAEPTSVLPPNQLISTVSSCR